MMEFKEYLSIITPIVMMLFGVIGKLVWDKISNSNNKIDKANNDLHQINENIRIQVQDVTKEFQKSLATIEQKFSDSLEKIENKFEALVKDINIDTKNEYKELRNQLVILSNENTKLKTSIDLSLGQLEEDIRRTNQAEIKIEKLEERMKSFEDRK